MLACLAGKTRIIGMSRLTITLDDDLHRALKEAAARQGRSITSIIEESLRLRGIQDQASARALVSQARKRAQLNSDKALELAVAETRATRKR
jgi:predicted transcriptional regulator